jgi:molecular chaperone HtpG
VLIGKEFDDMLPFWMNEFICGVIDSDDLPLNVSRETINQTKVMKVISKKVTRKIIERLEEFADDQEKEFELDEEYKDDKDNELYKEEKKKLKEAAFYYYEFLKN